MRKSLQLSLLIFIYLAFCCIPAYSQDANQPIQFSVSAVKTKYKPGDPIYLTLMWTNVSDKEIRLFVPDDIHKNWASKWEIKCSLTKPDGTKLVIQPASFSSIEYTPQPDHYQLLQPGESVQMPLHLRVKKEIPAEMARSIAYLNPDQEGDWVGLLDLPPRGKDWMPIEEIRKKYNVQGGFYSGNQGLREFLVLQDVLRDVFNYYGKYNLIFTYKNENATTFTPDDTSQTWKVVKVPKAWTGTLSYYLTLEIVE